MEQPLSWGMLSHYYTKTNIKAICPMPSSVNTDWWSSNMFYPVLHVNNATTKKVLQGRTRGAWTEKNKCVSNKHTFKVFVSCSWRCPRTSAPRIIRHPYMHWVQEATHKASLRVLDGLCVSPNSHTPPTRTKSQENGTESYFLSPMSGY